jgi:hypothetical protein
MVKLNRETVGRAIPEHDNIDEIATKEDEEFGCQCCSEDTECVLDDEEEH